MKFDNFNMLRECVRMTEDKTTYSLRVPLDKTALSPTMDLTAVTFRF